MKKAQTQNKNQVVSLTVVIPAGTKITEVIAVDDSGAFYKADIKSAGRK